MAAHNDILSATRPFFRNILNKNSYHPPLIYISAPFSSGNTSPLMAQTSSCTEDHSTIRAAKLLLTMVHIVVSPHGKVCESLVTHVSYSLMVPCSRHYSWSFLMTCSLLLILSHYVHIKGNRAFADLRYGREDSISPSTLIFDATKGY